MATVRPYINHLLQNSGITPACSEEERACAEDIAKIFSDHGFDPEVQEFTASGSRKLATAALGIAAFLGAVLMGVGGAVGVVGLLLALAAAVLYVMERMGKGVLSTLGAGGLSQNVIAYHKASGPLASPRNRPVVVVAHYDSPRADVLAQHPYAAYRPALAKLMPCAMVVPAAIAIVRLLPLPDAAKVVLWLVAIVAALVPLANAIAVIMNRAVLPYTAGAVCNKSSVAAMLGVMDAVAPFQGAEEFPEDIPFDEYFAEQRRVAEEIALAAQAQAEAEADEVPADGEDAASAEEGAEVDAGSAEVSAAPGDTAAMGAVDPASTAAMGAAAAVAGSAAAVSAAAAAPGATAPIDAIPSAPTGAIPTDGTAPIDGTASSTGFIAVDGTAPADDAAPGAAESVAEAEPSASAVENPDSDEVDKAAAATVVGGAAAAMHDEASEVVDAVVADAADELDGEGQTAEQEPAAEPELPLVNAHGNIRFGAEAIRSLGMLPESCVIEYEAPEVAPEPAPAAVSAESDAAVGDEGGLESIPDAASTADAVDGAFDMGDEQGPYDEDGYDEGAYADEHADGYDGAYDGHPEDDAPAPHRPATLIRPPRPSRPVAGQAAGFAAALSAVGERAAKLFDSAVRHGKDAIEAVNQRVAEHPAESFEPVDGESAVETDAAPAASEADATVAAEMDATVASGLEAPADDAPTDEGSDSEATQAMDLSEVASVDEAPLPDAAAAPAPADPGATVAAPAPEPVETVDSLMAQIQAPQRSMPRAIPDPAQPQVPAQPPVGNRAALLDLPDPSATPADPFAPDAPAPAAGVPASSIPVIESDAPSPVASVPSPGDAYAAPAQGGFSVISASDPIETISQPGAFETISADAPVADAKPARQRRGLGGLFGRKKKTEQSMSEFLGVGDDFDAKSSGRDIGSWDNFEDDDWKGGATGGEDVTADELRDAITSMGDDELLGHDIWFVATGASEYDHAGIRAFLNEHRDMLRGVFLINLECVGAGQVMMLATEGDRRVLKGDKRIMNLVSRVSSAFHNEYGSIEMPYIATDAYVAMDMSLRSLTLAGIDGPKIACSHTEEDAPYNVDVENINMVADVVTEVIRRC